MSTWLRYFAFWRRDAQRDARDEIAFHLEMRVKDLMARGATEQQARRDAEREFGDASAVQGQLERIDTLIAAVIPARRASRVDPLIAMRAE